MSEQKCGLCRYEGKRLIYCPEHCPEPFWHETHRYCPQCSWAERDDEVNVDEVTAAIGTMLAWSRGRLAGVVTERLDIVATAAAQQVPDWWLDSIATVLDAIPPGWAKSPDTGEWVQITGDYDDVNDGEFTRVRED